MSSAPTRKRMADDGDDGDDDVPTIHKKMRLDLFEKICPSASLKKAYLTMASQDLCRVLPPTDEHKAYLHAVMEQEKMSELPAENARREKWTRCKLDADDVLKDRIADESNAAFTEAVRRLKVSLSSKFGARASCIIVVLPTTFILSHDDADVDKALRNVFDDNQDVFSDFATCEAFLKAFEKAIPSLVIPVKLKMTTSSSIAYNDKSKIITITAPITAFHPTTALLMRESYWPILDELMGCSAAVVLGDPGTGKSSLLRVVYAMFVHGWPSKLTAEAKKVSAEMEEATKSPPFAKFRGVFWIMESGKYHYAVRENDTNTVRQGQGVYGGGDKYEKFWCDDEVLLLVDGSVPMPFLDKISNVFVFASPQPANYQRLMKASNAMRLTLPPWSREEVVHLLEVNKAMIWKRMFPYFKRIRSKAYPIAEAKGSSSIPVTAHSPRSITTAEGGAKRIRLAALLQGGDGDEAKEAEGAVNQSNPSARTVTQPPSTALPVAAGSHRKRFKKEAASSIPLRVSTRIKKAKENIQPVIASKSPSETISEVEKVARSAFDTWEYDEVTEFERIVQSNDVGTSIDTFPTGNAWDFLKAHIMKRFELVGGRIRILLNPSETFATLKRLVKSAVYAVSIEELQHENWIDSHRYVPSVVYSLVPSSPDPQDPPTAQFASAAISCFVIVRLAQANCTSVIQFLASDGGGSIFGSVLGHMFESFVHAELTSGKAVEMKRLFEPDGPSGETTSGVGHVVTFDKMSSEVVDFPTKPKKQIKTAEKNEAMPSSLEIKSGVYYKPARKNEAQVDSMVLLPAPKTMGAKGLPQLLLFQATISAKHTFIPNFIEQLVKGLNVAAGDDVTWAPPSKPTEYEDRCVVVFVVPKKNMEKFQYQTRLTTAKLKLKTSKGEYIPQYALTLEGSMFAHVKDCVNKVVHELRLSDVVASPPEEDPDASETPVVAPRATART